jgi:hypothetical protein
LSLVQQQQKQHKFQACRNGCGQLITFDKAFRGKNNGWIPLDEITDSLGQKKLQAHQCPAKNKQQPEQSATKEQPKQQPVVSNDLFKEIAAIKVQLLDIVSRLDRVEQQQTAH